MFWILKCKSWVDTLLVTHDDIILLFVPLKTWSVYQCFSRKECIFHKMQEGVKYSNLKVTPGDSDVHGAPN